MSGPGRASLPLALAAVLMAIAALQLARAAESAERTALRATRSAGRAYEGAPPTVPHWFNPRDQRVCLRCHETGADVGTGRPAPIAPHPGWPACLQCHAARATDGAALPASTFSGQGLPAPGRRVASPGAPPIVPHRLFGRERCAACHAGPGTPAVIRCSHPERPHCLQCHPTDQALEAE